jgi:lipopolysaccharide biosynthesis glycosyltransferase
MASPAGGVTVNVVCAADADYAMPLAVMLRSALARLRDRSRLAIHVVDGGIRADDWARLEELCRGDRAELYRHEPVGSSFAGLPAWGRMSPTTYYRLMLPRLLPPDLDRAIWLDCDLLVEADITGLWELDLGGHALLAVQDELVPRVSSRYGVRSWRALGLPAEAPYFNSGVMLVDLGRWRAEQIEQRVVRYLREHQDEVVFWDQEGLNAVLCGRWRPLDPRWNRTVRPSPSGSESAPRVLHFNGMLKPWLLPEPSSGPRARFYRHLDETPWAGWRPPRTARTSALGWYEASLLRRLVQPAEPVVMVTLRRRLWSRGRR